MGKHYSIFNVVSTLNSTGKRGWVASGGRLHGRSSRNTVPISSNIKVGTQVVPRSLVLSFYSILRGAPVFVGPVYDTPLLERRERKQINPSTSSRHTPRCWQFEQLSSPRCTVTTPTDPFQYPGLSKREYSGAVSSSSKPPSPRSRRQPSATSGDPVDKKDDKATPPRRSVLHPPKQAPSVWQIFFTDWLQKQKSSAVEGKKLNVAQEAKEAGHVYNELSEEARDALQQRAHALKEKYDREFAAWKRTLTPADIERENAFRTAQRKSGKSRRKNINDPSAPKRPLTAYFLFLQAIRADPQRVKDVFGDATESTRQSVLAAAKWRRMSDAEKQPYLSQAEGAKREYEANRREYDERLRSQYEYAVTSVVVYPGSSLESPTKVQECGGMSDATVHK